MSHFTVMVIGKNIDESLEPFWELDLSKEEIKNDPRSEFNDCTEEVEELWNGTTNAVRMPDGRMLLMWDEEFSKCDSLGIGTDTHEIPEGLKKEKVPTSEYAMCKGFSKDEWVKDWFGYSQNEEGAWGYWSNPNAKWDWCSLGGRWSGYFKVKEGVPKDDYVLGDSDLMCSTSNRSEGWADQIQKGNIDMDGMRADAEKKANALYDIFEKAIDGLPVAESWETVRNRHKNIDDAREFYRAQPMKKAMSEVKELGWYGPGDFFVGDGGRAKFVENSFCNVFIPFAVVNEDGEWVEKGEMGWWGCVSNKKLQYDWSAKFLKMFEGLPDDTWIAIVDCHI